MEVVTAYFTFMNSLGVQSGRLIESLMILACSFILVLWLGRKYIVPFIKTIITTVDEMKKSVTDLNHTLQEHIVQTDLRLQAGEQRFEGIQHDIKEIKTHIGMK